MASTLRKETSDIIKSFFENPSSFSFIQAVRLLSLHEKDNFSSFDAFLEQGLSIVPELSLGHPSTDIVSIKHITHDIPAKEESKNSDGAIEGQTEKSLHVSLENNSENISENLLENSQDLTHENTQEADALDYKAILRDLDKQEKAELNLLADVPLEVLDTGNILYPENSHNPYDIDAVADNLKYKIEVTFLALYGSSSPLPTFYTEELLDEAKEDGTACRDFLDIFNQLLYIIYYKAFNRYKLALRTIENKDTQLLNLQYALMGFANPYLREEANISFTDLRFIKSFIRYNRSAEDLEVFLSWRLNVAHVEVEQCVMRQMHIPKQQYCKLGTKNAKLGDAVIGTQITDLSNKIRIHLKNLNNYDMKRFAFSGRDYHKIENCLRIYLDTVPDYDVVLHSEEGALPCIKLGDSGRSLLGVTSFLTEPTISLSTSHRIGIYS